MLPPSCLAQHSSLPSAGSEASRGRGPQLTRAASGQNSSWEDTGFIHKTGGDPSIWTKSYSLLRTPPTNSFPQNYQHLPNPLNPGPRPRALTPHPILPGPGAEGPVNLSPVPTATCTTALGEWHLCLADPSTAQLPASLISITHSPSVATATSCSAPSGVRAPAILGKGRLVPCPVYLRLSPAWPEGALPKACLTPWPEISALPMPQPPSLHPSPPLPVASVPPPATGEEAGSDGWRYQGSPPRALYLAASGSSLPATKS